MPAAQPALNPLVAATFNPNSLAATSAQTEFYNQNPAGVGSARDRAMSYLKLTQDPRYADVQGANQQNIEGLHSFLGQQDWGLGAQNQQALADQAGQLQALQDAGYITAADLPAQQDISGIGANAESIAQTRAQLQGVEQQLANLPPSATPEDVARLTQAQTGLQQQLSAIDTSGIGQNQQQLAQQAQSIQALQQGFTGLRNNFVPGVGVVQDGVPTQQVVTDPVTGLNTPVTETGIPGGGAARPAIDAYLAGTNPTNLDFSAYSGTQGAGLRDYGDLYEYDFTPPPADTGGGDDGAPVDTGYTGATDAAGVPAPYLGVDEYDTEGDDNFLDQDEYQEQVDIISDDLGIDYDPTKTFEEQLSAEDYAEFQDASLGESPAQTAADTIYNNNQQIYGEETGNNVTSLVTGNVTGLDDAGIEELQSAPDDKTWAGGGGEDSSPVENLINQQVDDYQSKVESGEVKKFDINDPSTWVDPNAGKSDGVVDKVTETVSDIVDKATGVISGGGSDGVGNFGAVGDVLGGIGDALGITDYAGEAEAKAAEEAAAAKAAEEAAAAKAAADAENARIVAERQAAAEAERKRQAAAAEAERQRIAAEQAAAKKAAEEAAAKKAAEEAAAAESNITEEGTIDWDSNQTVNAQDKLAAGEITFVEYLNEIGYYNAANKNIDLGFQVGLGSTGSAGHSQAPATSTGYVAGDGPVHTTTGQHTVENEPDGATATTNYQEAKAAVNNNDDSKSHAEIIAEHNALREAETSLIQSDLSDDDFWDAYEDDDDGGGGGSSNDTSTVICTALMEMGELDPTIWKYDLMYGEQYVSATTYRGYHDWAIPMVPKVKARHWLYFPLAKVMAKAWAYQMAHFMSNGEHGKSSLLGKAICWFGEGYCTWRGKRIEAREEGGDYAKSKST